MSNERQITRCLKLLPKIGMMIVDGKRDPEKVANLLQTALEDSFPRPVFDFVLNDEAWVYAEPRDQRSVVLGLLDDYSKVILSTDWIQDEASVDGETRRSRILANTQSVALNCEHFLHLREKPHKIPEKWKEASLITFDGDVLRDKNGNRCVLWLLWSMEEWCRGCYPINHFSWNSGYPSRRCRSAQVAI